VAYAKSARVRARIRIALRRAVFAEYARRSGSRFCAVWFRGILGSVGCCPQASVQWLRR